MSTTKKFSLILLIAAIAVILWYAISLSKKQVQPENNRPVEIATTTEEVNIASTTEPVVVATSTKDWLTYRNEEYGFEIKYPKDYLMKKIKGGINLKHPTYDLVPISPAKGGSVSIALTNTKIEDHIKAIENTDPPLSRVISQKEYILDDVKGIEIISTYAEGLDYYDIFIKYNNKNYLVSYGDIGYNYTKEILNTFEFIKPVMASTNIEDWPAYRNEEYGFEFQYPKTWTYNKGEYVSFRPSSQKDCTLNTGRTVKESSCSDEIFLFIEPNDKKLSLGEFFRDKGRWKKGEDYEDIKEFTIGNIIVYKVTLISAYDGSRLESFWAPLSDEKFLELKEFLPKENKSVFNQMISTFKFIK
ncbi:MAG: PsbP-related protein [bacterium]|nr:PsbP-related protein [bacterium]